MKPSKRDRKLCCSACGVFCEWVQKRMLHGDGFEENGSDLTRVLGVQKLNIAWFMVFRKEIKDSEVYV